MAAPSPRPELAAVTTWLIDTGPLVAYVDARDRAHEAVAACLGDFTGQLATSSAVVTEAMHLGIIQQTSDNATAEKFVLVPSRRVANTAPITR